MKLIVLLFLCHCASAVRHSLHLFYTVSSGVPNLPDFVIVGMVDDIQTIYYDSNTEKLEHKQDYIKKDTADDPQHWESQSQRAQAAQEWFKPNMEILMYRLNQTGGVHIYQNMYGCEWDDETGEVNSFEQHGFDGEDFISFDVKTGTWIAPRQQAVITKHNWNNNEIFIAFLKNYFTHECLDYLKKYLELGRSSLLRTELPSVSFLQKTPSSPVSCHATGFYPGTAALMWTKDGVELHEEVQHGEILPNQDGTFQLSAELNLESAQPEEWRRYQCVFQLAGGKNMASTLDKTKILTNWENPPDQNVIIIIIAVVCVLLFTVALIVGAVCLYKKMNESDCPSSSSSTDVGSKGSQGTSQPLMMEEAKS
ncbi:major histocompatibility complex class I-related protein 1-like isoform X2 [Nelusetta ayraudi]|uniref:major histocompatibility complex class I-related protein 1-like isoform X2 n=1 Tax=Nelusetta ayraudi TaxID=303726 RepID=UPI003F71E8F5